MFGALFLSEVYIGIKAPWNEQYQTVDARMSTRTPEI